MPDTARKILEEFEREAAISVRAGATDPVTSHEAARALESNQGHLQQSVERVVEILRETGPLPDFRLRSIFLERFAGSDSLPTKARMWAREKGLVRDTGLTAVNPTSNRRCIVWGPGRDDDFLDYELVKCPECGHKVRQKKEEGVDRGEEGYDEQTGNA